MTCKTCAHWSPKAAKEMARHRMAPCSLGAPWTYFGETHSCPKHRPAAEDVVAARVVWLNRKKG